MKLRAWLAIVIWASAVGAPSGAGGGRLAYPQARPTAKQLLDRYARRDYAFVTASLETISDPKAFGRELAQIAPGWILEEGAASAPSRRLAVAAFALEAARPAMDSDRPDTLSEEEQPVGDLIIEWACQLLRTSPPLPAERWWHLAAVALIERSYDRYYLTGFIDPKVSSRLALQTQQRHGHAADQLAHARERFPGEPRFALASIVTAEVHQSFGRIGWLNASSVAVAPGEEPGWRHLLDAYANLAATSETVRAEADLRAGVIEFRFERYAASLERLAQVEANTNEPYLIYLSRFFRGLALERTGRPGDAEWSYRSALRIVPDAPSASTALATLIFQEGERNEAALLAQHALGGGPDAKDPWRVYWSGDHRLWPTLIARLRQELP